MYTPMVYALHNIWFIKWDSVADIHSFTRLKNIDK